MTRALLSFPPGLGVRAILFSLREKLRQMDEEEAWRIYCAKCLRMITENTANASGGTFMAQEFADILHPKPQDNRGVDEIAEDVLARAGISVKTGGDTV